MSDKPEQLVVMSWAGGWGKALEEAVSKPFTEATGVPVHHQINIGLKLPHSLLDAIDLNLRPPFDVVWSNSVPAMRLAQLGACIPLNEEAIPNLKRLSRRAKPEAFSDWPIVFPYIVHYVMVYREAAVDGRSLDSWELMLEPRFKGRIALYPGGNGFYPIAQILGGGSVEDIPHDMTACWEFFRKLRPQIGRLDYSIGMGELIRREILDICFRALPNAIAFQNEGLDVSWITPKEGVPDAADALWIPQNVPDDIAFWSMKYIDFALSREVQERWSGMLGVLPMHLAAGVPEILLNTPGLPKSPDDFSGILYVPEIIKMRHELEWENNFNQIIESAPSLLP